VLVRLAQEGKEGKFLNEELVKHMWKDMDIKSKTMTVCEHTHTHWFHIPASF